MTDQLLRFEPVIPLWPFIVVAIVLSGSLIWMELKRTAKFKSVRLVATIILLIAVLGILANPMMKTKNSDVGILLTEDYDKLQLDSLKRLFPSANIYALKPAKYQKAKKTVVTLHDLPVDEVKFVLGRGLAPAEIETFDQIAYQYLPGNTVEGIIDLSVPKKIQAESQSVIAGIYNNGSDTASIVLSGPGGREDSVSIYEKGPVPFRLQFTPKQKGQLLYSISVNGKEAVLPLSINSARRLNILILQTFPTFETGYLKNILGEQHNLVIRYQLSKNKYRYEYLNHRQIRAERLTKDITKGMDLVILDTDAFASLSINEKITLSESIHDGLGALILFNGLPKSTASFRSLLPVTFINSKRDTAHFSLAKKLMLQTWPVEPKNDGKIIPTIKNSDRILAGYVYQGFGKIGFEILQQTYQLMLTGDSSSYKNLWKTIILGNARNEERRNRIEVKNQFPVFPGEPIVVEVLSTEKTPVLLHEGQPIALAEDVLIDEVWTTKIWPGKNGWHDLQLQGDSTKESYYVSERESWKSLAKANSTRITKAHSSKNFGEQKITWRYESVGAWIFFAMFIVSAALLWLLPKL